MYIICYNLNIYGLSDMDISCVGYDIDVGDLVYEPPRDGPTLWEIGIPDRSAAEFYVPDPNPKYINTLYVNHPDRLPTLFFNLIFFFMSKI
jgi:hypothetical protein